MATIALLEFYSQYLTLKEEIRDKTNRLRGPLTPEQVVTMREELEELTQQFRFVLSEMRARGMDFEKLILLSVGIEVELFN